MKRLLVGTALTLFAAAPAIGWADCEYHNAAAMASAAPTARPEAAHARVATSKALVTAKASAARQVKSVADKATSSPSSANTPAVVAKGD